MERRFLKWVRVRLSVWPNDSLCRNEFSALKYYEARGGNYEAFLERVKLIQSIFNRSVKNHRKKKQVPMSRGGPAPRLICVFDRVTDRSSQLLVTGEHSRLVRRQSVESRLVVFVSRHVTFHRHLSSNIMNTLQLSQ